MSTPPTFPPGGISITVSTPDDLLHLLHNAQDGTTWCSPASAIPAANMTTRSDETTCRPCVIAYEAAPKLFWFVTLHGHAPGRLMDVVTRKGTIVPNGRVTGQMWDEIIGRIVTDMDWVPDEIVVNAFSLMPNIWEEA